MVKVIKYVEVSIIIFICLILLFSLNHQIKAEEITHIVINEIMYDPEQDDNFNEWIELFNPTNQSINVSGWAIEDNYSEDIIEGDTENGNGTTIIPPKRYAIIADHGTAIYENFSISNETIKLYVDDNSIGNGLGNTKDKLILKNSTGNISDAVEWGENYTDVPGSPADLVEEGHSLTRIQGVDEDDSSTDFYEGIIPTPGGKNIVVAGPEVKIDLYPTYIPKIQNNSDYSIPFALKTNMSNFLSNQTYQLKVYIIGNSSSTFPATQVWDGNDWKYSYYYSNITTDVHGNLSEWIYLRFNGDYKEYQSNIANSNSSYLNIKMKKDDTVYELTKEVFLLDLDKSTSNGTAGGYAVGIAENNNSILSNKTIIIENNTGNITGIYKTENNGIEDNFISCPGYYKIPSPEGSNYTIKFIDNNGSVIHSITNITILQGDYGIELSSLENEYFVRRNEEIDISITMTNIGDFNDTFNISIDQLTEGWNATLNYERFVLNSGGSENTTVHVIPCQEDGCRSGTFTLSAISETDIGRSDMITISVELLGPDLTVPNIICYDEYGVENTTFGQGELVKIKAYVKNIGNENGTEFNVKFYYDSGDNDHYIGEKHYDSISKWQKYPSIKWDTTHINSGDHTIFVIVDEERDVEEISEHNNERSMDIHIYDTSPDEYGKTLLITEIYYHAHPSIKNEFMTIFNPTSQPVDISGWYLTNTPQKQREDQTKLAFPKNTIFPSMSSICITQNASAFQWETGKKPDFEYAADSQDDVLQMICPKTYTLSNTKGAIALKSEFNHTIDVVIYGESDISLDGWEDVPVEKSGEGVILKRNIKNTIPVDTNTSNDWKHPRRYGIGQSDFPYVSLSCTGEIKTFVSPDCSFQAIVNELRNATESIYFNIYEFTNPFLCDELVSALRRNVSVNIFVEGSPVGGIDDREKFILNRIRNSGGKIRFIVSDKANDVYARYPFDHGKYLVIDNQTIIVESCNWAKTGIPVDPTFGNREWGIIVRNEQVAQCIVSIFLDDWDPNRCDSYSFDDMDMSFSPDFYIDKSVYSGSYSPQFESKIFTGSFKFIPAFSPDTSYHAICNLIDSSQESIYIEQLYIYKDWESGISPFVERLVNKSEQGVDIKVIMNYNPEYDSTNEECNQTKQYFEEHGIEVKFIYTNWSVFTNIHNKGMIVDNRSVLIASINWNENSVTRNREAGIIIENESVASYYAEVFLYDWNLKEPTPTPTEDLIPLENLWENHKNTIYTALIFTMTFGLIARDWRKRKWT